MIDDLLAFLMATDIQYRVYNEADVDGIDLPHKIIDIEDTYRFAFGYEGRLLEHGLIDDDLTVEDITFVLDDD